MEDPVVPFEWARLFFGEHPALYYLEIIFRSLLIYFWTLAMIRWLGGRSMAQLSLVDFLLVIALGSAVGDATFYADVPLGQAMAVIFVVVAATKALERFVLLVPAASPVVDDDPIPVFRDGHLLMECLKSREVPPTSLFEQLRLRDVTNLGELDAVWIESAGGISLLRRKDPCPGLPIMPPHECAPPDPGPPGDGACCLQCGGPGTATATRCPNCGGEDWTRAILGAGPVS